MASKTVYLTRYRDVDGVLVDRQVGDIIRLHEGDFVITRVGLGCDCLPGGRGVRQFEVQPVD